MILYTAYGNILRITSPYAVLYIVLHIIITVIHSVQPFLHCEIREGLGGRGWGSGGWRGFLSP